MEVYEQELVNNRSMGNKGRKLKKKGFVFPRPIPVYSSPLMYNLNFTTFNTLLFKPI